MRNLQDIGNLTSSAGSWMDGCEVQEKGHGCRGSFGSCHPIDGTSMGMNEIVQLKKRVVSISATCYEDRLDMG